MYHPVLSLKTLIEDSDLEHEQIHFDIVQIGTGGNGGYLVQRLSKILYAFSLNRHFSFSYSLVDGDIVESKNLLRQPFIDDDLNLHKSKVLAERYGNAYDYTILYRDTYIESADDLIKCFQSPEEEKVNIPILIGCVDNNATRKIMHEVFERLEHIIYIDSGIDGIDPDDQEESGYTGQVVCGIKMKNEVLLDPVGVVYDNILLDNESRLPTEACGETIVNHPQRMQTNEMAALVMAGYLNTILGESKIVTHYTNFNALTMTCRPTYIKSPVGVLDD
jgi:hypothetical protein